MAAFKSPPSPRTPRCASQGEGIKSEPYRLFNLDVFEYLHESPFGLYGSIPFLMAHGPRGATGLFWLNAAEMYVDVSTESAHPHTQWIAETGKLDLFIMIGACASPGVTEEGESGFGGLTREVERAPASKQPT